MQQIDIKQAQLQLNELFNAALKGEEIIFTENNRPILRLALVAEPPARRQLGQGAGEVWMSEDFNESYEEWPAK
jgi:antitoxin (DNA-binding transcriptional repressor) of toxin-antitoxin stability system